MLVASTISQRNFTYVISFQTERTNQNYLIQPKWKTDLRRPNNLSKFTLQINAKLKSIGKGEETKGLNFKGAKVLIWNMIAGI
jgi:hypothetical protein